MLTPKQFDKWVKALRSGEFKQGRYQLFNNIKTDPKYCCLGVCRKVNRLDNISIYLSFTKIHKDCQDHLMEMNDYKKRSFKQIAYYLERNRSKYVDE